VCPKWKHRTHIYSWMEARERLCVQSESIEHTFIVGWKQGRE